MNEFDRPCIESEAVNDLQVFLRAVADATRLRILCLLFDGEKSVCYLEERLGVSQPLVSHHLSVLRDVGLIRSRKSGTWSYYSLVPEAMFRLNQLFLRVLGAEKIPENYPFREECDELAVLK
ncbi:metalloregulator ArsR/SmtB family transcription factor [Candidatus Solincola tengchongensis]|uniref:ArsR/SmtB family transcription factor n=1 Tax=Candidatus Solincola tengchongensis TaxID=2900693 RepID=UPI002579A2FF|nr:metalloregulator ArsR/SmtB family transcription factor [Candidatus Solincola tengchongensis]